MGKRAVLSAVLCLSYFLVFAGDTLSYRIGQAASWAFYGTSIPAMNAVLVNDRGVEKGYNIVCDVRNHCGVSMYGLMQQGKVQPKDSALISFSFKTLSPGFYSFDISDNGRFVRRVNVAYEPEKIADTLESPDIKDYPNRNFAIMADICALNRRSIDPQFSIVRNKGLSGRDKNVYDFKMISIGNEQINGYMAFPKGKKGLSAMVTFVVDGEQAANPLADFTAPAHMAELVVYLKERGEGDEYFKNLFTDIILSIDFLCGRGEIDASRIYAQGTGFAGACALVAGALDDRVAVSVVADPDFEKFALRFSVASLAGKVTSATLMGFGLQADTDMLHRNFVFYNSLKPYKEYFAFEQSTDVERLKWKYIRDTFLVRRGVLME